MLSVGVYLSSNENASSSIDNRIICKKCKFSSQSACACASGGDCPFYSVLVVGLPDFFTHVNRARFVRLCHDSVEPHFSSLR
nr:MAG TPA: hypothetical protein [Microviridae sp.]